MDRGELVSDDLITGIVRERLTRPDAAGGFVLDGFPRTVPQARALDGLLAGRDTLIVIEMQVPDEELVRRVQGRRVCKSCGTNVSAFGGDGADHRPLPEVRRRAGDALGRQHAVVRERLKIYWRDTRPVIEYYNGRPTFRAIDGAQSPEQVRQMLVTTITGLAASAGVVVPPAGHAADGAAGSAGMITCRSAAELERLARVNALVARVLAELMRRRRPGVTTAGPGPARRAAAARGGGACRRSRAITGIRRRSARRSTSR